MFALNYRDINNQIKTGVKTILHIKLSKFTHKPIAGLVITMILFILQGSSLSAQVNTQHGITDQIQEQIDMMLITYADSGQLKTVKSLISVGANPNAQTWDGTTALMYASEKGHYPVVRELIANHAEINTSSIDLFTALHYATISNHDSIAELLILNGANVHPIEYRGMSPLHYASAYGYPFLANLLLYYGAHIDSTDYYGNTPLMQAVYYGSSLTAQMLLEEWADVDKADKDGYTPLMVAAQFNDTTLIQLLLDYGANPLAKNLAGNTALALAIESQADQAIEQLLFLGTAQEKYSDKFSYADIAYRKGYGDLAKFLNQSMDLPLKKKPYINRLDLIFGFSTSSNDFYLFMGSDMRIAPYNIIVGGNVGIRPYYKTVVRESDYVTLQLLELRSYLSLYALKEIVEIHTSKNSRYTLSLGLLGLYSDGFYNVKGLPHKPYKYIKASPTLRISYNKRDFVLSMETYYNRMHHNRQQPLFFELSAGYRFDFSKPKISLKKIY